MDDDPARRDEPARPDDPARHDDPADRIEPARSARPDLRVGDADRQAALQALGAHLEAGRLDIDEYGDRSACAAVAVRRAELAALFDDLPAPHPVLPERPVPGVPAPAPAPVPVPVERHGRDRAPAVQGLMVGLVLVMVIALPGLLVAAGAAGMGGGGLLFLPLMLLLLGSGRPGRRRFGPGGPGRGPWHG